MSCCAGALPVCAAAVPPAASERLARPAVASLRRWVTIYLLSAPSVGGRLPGRTGVVGGGGAGALGGLGAEVGLEHRAVRADQERHHAGVAVGRGPGEQREAGHHVAVDHVAVGAARRVRPLPGQDAEVVAVVGRARLPALEVVAGLGDEGPERARRFALGGRPVETVPLVARARDALRVLQHPVAGTVLAGVLALRLDEGTHDLDRGELVATDAAVRDLLGTGGGIEAPAF